MNRILVLSVFVLTLLLSACSGKYDEMASTEAQSNSEATDLEKENEALRKELAEKENEELKAELEASKEDDSEDNSAEKKKEDLSTEEETEEEQDKSDPEDSYTGNRADLYFDLNDDHVKNQLIGTDYGNDDSFFEQSAIAKGMSQTEVEEKYGAYDFTAYSSGAAPAYYGNLAVVYSEYAPYGTSGEPERTDINPDTNYVESVFYYADITPDEMISILGEPDSQDDGNFSDNGLPYYAYHGKGSDGRYYGTGAGTYNLSTGLIVGIMKREIHDENPYDTETSSTDESYLSGYDDGEKYDILSDYIKNYVTSLTLYYNEESNDVLNYVSGNALSQLQENRASDYFSNHENLGVKVIEIEQLSSEEYKVTIERDYSHANSSGHATTQVTYTVIDGDDKLQITDFE